MLNVLLESRANGERRRGGTVASVALHTMVIVGAVVATASGKSAPREPKHEIIIPLDYHETPVRARVRSENPPSGAGSIARMPIPTSPVRFDITKIPVGIPSVNETPIFDPGEFRPRAVDFGRIGPEGHGRGPDIGGAWTPDAVEVLATLLPPAPSPAYPDMLRRAGVAGRVVVRFVVDTTGRIELPSVQILASSHDLLEQEVRRVLPRYRFRPAEVGGKTVRMLVELPFEFSLR